MVEEKNIIKIQEIFLGLSIIALPFDSIPDIFSISIYYYSFVILYHKKYILA